MSNRDFAIASNKFFYYVMNYEHSKITYPTIHSGEVSNYLPEFFNAFDKYSIEHLYGKFKYFHEKYGSYGAIMAFYGELDGDNRWKLMKWINENYKQRDGFGISLEED